MRGELLQRPHLASETQRLEGAARYDHETIGIEGLLDEVVGAPFDRSDCRLDRSVTRDHDHRQIRMLSLHDVEQGETIEPAAFQPNVEQKQIRTPCSDRAECLFGVFRRSNGVSFVLQDSRYELPNVRFIVDDKDIRGHYSPC